MAVTPGATPAKAGGAGPKSPTGAKSTGGKSGPSVAGVTVPTEGTLKERVNQVGVQVIEQAVTAKVSAVASPTVGKAAGKVAGKVSDKALNTKTGRVALFMASFGPGALPLLMVIAMVGVTMLVLVGLSSAAASGSVHAATEAGVPEPTFDAYMNAADAENVPWEILAAVAHVQTDHGRNAPDGTAREGDDLFPKVNPPIVVEHDGRVWAGTMLIDTAVLSEDDAQNVDVSADVLAKQLHLSLERHPMFDPAIRWVEQRDVMIEVIDELPVRGFGASAPVTATTPTMSVESEDSADDPGLAIEDRGTICVSEPAQFVTDAAFAEVFSGDRLVEGLTPVSVTDLTEAGDHILAHAPTRTVLAIGGINTRGSDSDAELTRIINHLGETNLTVVVPPTAGDGTNGAWVETVEQVTFTNPGVHVLDVSGWARNNTDLFDQVTLEPSPAGAVRLAEILTAALCPPVSTDTPATPGTGGQVNAEFVFTLAAAWHNGNIGPECVAGSFNAFPTNGPVNVGDRLAKDGREMTEEMMANAQTIILTGRNMGVPDHGLMIAIATALPESGLVNIDFGDRDSVGLFQQRPSQGWGTVEQIMDPVYASTKFYEALLRVPNWRSMPPGDAAQAVQRSAFPDEYAKWMTDAAGITESVLTAIDNLSEGDGSTTTTVTPTFVGFDGSCLPSTQLGTSVEDGPAGPIQLVEVPAVNGPPIRVATELAPALTTLLERAAADGIALGGSGWRSMQRQVELRTTNGCPDVWTAPASSCRVPTAIPGRSLHERGLAVDFTCDGVTVRRGTRCDSWLMENGPTVGLRNLPSEAWHYSLTGG